MVIELNGKLIDTASISEIGEIQESTVGSVKFNFLILRANLSNINVILHTNCVLQTGHELVKLLPKEFEYYNCLLDLKKAKSYKNALVSITNLRNNLSEKWSGIKFDHIPKLNF